MNGEELNREYHEKLEWKRTEVRNHFSGFADLRQWWRVPGGGEIRDRLPNLHEDANLCIAELDRVFGQWSISREHDGKYWSLVYDQGEHSKAEYPLTYEGATFNEAALKALIAARTK